MLDVYESDLRATGSVKEKRRFDARFKRRGAENEYAYQSLAPLRARLFGNKAALPNGVGRKKPDDAESGGGGDCVYEFQTPHTLSVTLMRRVSGMFPNLDFLLYYSKKRYACEFYATFKGGRMTCFEDVDAEYERYASLERAPELDWEEDFTC
jgi:hypothetical protein